MLFILNKETHELENTKENGKKVIKMIEEKENNHMYLTHAEIDGHSIHDDIDLYIEDHIHSINEIKAHMLSEKELKEDTLQTMNEYIHGALPEVEKLTGNLYADKQEGWDQVPVLLDGINWIVQAIRTLNQLSVHTELEENLYKTSLELTERVKLLQEPLEEHDSILLSDIISYEVVPVLETISGFLDDLLDEEGTSLNAN
ncbi:hypothetical protein [Salimicrobium halophilum]|uniref:Uncharacterized protein n=1 Tax=Salimicrobium halophilum TaxID=86666 RepID=A0A1G8V520_9BACI|nr:hypothetical protein [Salimicrobium halophilum]SDJ60270.1 hypothetical protein SAMN04490247_2462 [Salimicrobium halophilum]